MRRVGRQQGRRMAVLLAAFAVLAGVAATPAAAHHPETAQPFFADVRSACTYGWTEGHLSWKAWHPPDTPGVNVAGIVAARPISDDCAELIPLTFADFQAFIGLNLVDRELVPLDQGNPTSFQFTLAAPFSTPVPPEIDRVMVRACRGFPPDFLVICGDPEVYVPPQ